MEYELSVIVTLSIFAILDLIILINSIRNSDGSNTQKVFLRFAAAATLQQLFAVMTQLSAPAFHAIGNGMTYVAYIGALVFLTAASYYWYRYLWILVSGDRKSSLMLRAVRIAPVLVIAVTCLLSPVTHWLFYIDESGVYQRGSLFFLQIVCPYAYLLMLIVLAISRRNNKDQARVKKILRFFLVFMIPSMVGVFNQMFVVKGGYSAVGVSMGLVLMYLEVYIEDANERKRLKSIESLNVKLQRINEEQNARIHEIAALNTQLENRMNMVQSISSVYFVSFYANLSDDSFTEISNTDFVRKYVGANGTASQALEIFCDKMVHPQFAEQMREFVDFSTLNDRLRNKDFITVDYLGNVAGWCQLYYIAGERADDGTLKTVFLASRTIHDEKEREFAQNRALENARIAAETANAAKTVFLNNMSHDIRTPLNAILGFSDLMVQKKDDPAVLDDYLQKIKTSGEYLLSIINNVLDMARIESGKVTVENSVMDLLTEGVKIRAYAGELVEASNHRFSMGSSLTHRYVMIDVAKQQQIMMNLVSNAVKYTPENGKIHLQVDELPCDKPGFGTFRMTVSDTGIGMTPEFLEHIFDSFARERNTTDSKVIGTGLGMSIVKRLVDLMGGTIEVQSEEGKGSTFIVTCDLALADDPGADMNGAGSDTAVSVTLEGKRILLTEDNELNAEIAIAVLEDAGLLVEHAENGMVCIDMLEKAPEGYYDLILMDIQMPVLNGYEAAKRIRESGRTIPIVAMTANAFEEDKRNAIASGMNAHLSKPIDVAKVMDTLAALLC